MSAVQEPAVGIGLHGGHKAALVSNGIKTGVIKLKTDLKTTAGGDVITQDKINAFANDKAAGGQA